MSEGILLPPRQPPASRLRAGNLLSGRIRNFYFVPAGVVWERDLQQHVGVERRGVRRGKTCLVWTFGLKYIMSCVRVVEWVDTNGTFFDRFMT